MRISHTNKPHIVLTMGDPAGIGPEVLVKALKMGDVPRDLCTVIIGDAEQLKKCYAGTDTPAMVVHSSGDDVLLDPNALNVIDPGPLAYPVIPGIPDENSTLKSLKFIDLAIDLIKKISGSTPKAMVTGPVNKGKIADISEGFIGHTEYLQNAFSRDHVTMAMVGKAFTVIPVTRHIPVKYVSNRLTVKLLSETLEDVALNLNTLSCKQDPIVCVCSLNPHCGEEGKIGDEEINVIIPAVQSVKNSCMNLVGPISSDVAFYKAIKGHVDIVVGMYHDQCLAPFKMVEFDTGVNTTLGLGFVRTSPDHGTAYDIAGKNTANPESMCQAIELAIKAITR